MLRIALIAAFAVVLMPYALAQQRPDPAFLEKALTSMEAQRNSAMNAHAATEARLALANEEIARLKAEIEKLTPKKEAPTDAKQKP